MHDDLVALLQRLQLPLAPNPASCDVLMVHRKTDALYPDDRQAFLKRGGLYVEYTGGGVNWEVKAERHLFGSYHELLRRLNTLSPPLSMDSLRQALEMDEVSIEHLVALAILCQGYLAVHAADAPNAGDWAPQDLLPALTRMGWPSPEDSSARTLVGRDLARQRPVVRSANWWREDLLQDPPHSLRQVIVREWQESADHPLPDALRQLVEKIDAKQEVIPVTIVAEAYLALAQRLEGRR